MQVDTENVLVNLREEIEVKDAELAACFYTLEDLYERKLWYQLSQVLHDSVYKNTNSRTIRLKLFDNFILTFGDKINQLQLVEFLIVSLEDSTAQDSLEYLNTLKSKIHKLKEKSTTSSENINDFEIIQALIYLDNEIAHVKLLLGFVDEAVSMVDRSEEAIEGLNDSVDNRVNASFYKVKAEIMKQKGDFNQFYYNSLLFLACVDKIELLQNKEEIVRDICISGLLGDKIFNFGEIIMHEIFKSLKNEWLKELVLSLNSGNLQHFNELISNSQQLNEFGDLVQKLEFLKQKVCIMAFIEMVFNRPTTSRCLEYSEILKKIPLLTSNNEIEHLVMKCLSLGLIKGLINQVEENVEVSWILPRTMTMEQVENMKVKMELWNDKVSELNNYMNNHGGELLA